MNNTKLMRLAGIMLLAASFFIFAYGLASVFYGTWWLTVIIALVFALLLHFGFHLFDKADARDNIRTENHGRDLDGAMGLIHLYADKYHDKDAEYAKEHIEALKDISNNEDYHIQRALEYDERRLEEERLIIELSKDIRRKYEQ